MTTLCTSHLSRRASLLATFALAFAATCVLAPRAGAQEAAKTKAETTPPATVTPYAEFQNSTLTGTTNTINVSNLPVVTGTGSIVYDNVTIPFNVAADGTLTVGSVQITSAPSVDVNSFEAGTYDAPAGTNPITVSGPGIANGGATEWSIAAQTGSCQDVTSAAWYVGPIKSSPYYTRIKAAGVPLTGFSYGVGSGNCSGGDWGNDSLLGFAQTGGQLTIFSFTFNGVDQNQPAAQISYTLQP